MNNEMAYNKKYHFLDSCSVFLDIDSLLYILISTLLIWLIVNMYYKWKKRKKISFDVFISRYMLVCSIPVFVFYAIMLAISGVYVFNNIVILFLPLLYASIIQFVFRRLIKKR